MRTKTGLLQVVGVVSLILQCILLQYPGCASPQSGQIVWWGRPPIQYSTYPAPTNGVTDFGEELLTNAIDSPVRHPEAVALLDKQTRYDSYEGNIICGPSDITAISSSFDHTYLALKNDGSLIGLDCGYFNSYNDSDTSLRTNRVRSVVIRGKFVTNVVALASMISPIALNADGTVIDMGRRQRGSYDVGAQSGKLLPTFQYNSAQLVTIVGLVLTNVTKIAGGLRHGLALKKDRTVVAWGDNSRGQTNVPAGLSNVVAIAATADASLALKSDGTVIAWGCNSSGRPMIAPAGLSNVTMIAADRDFCLALTTGPLPPSVFMEPKGILETMERQADLVFKGTVTASRPIPYEFATTAAFRSPIEARETVFHVISTLKGEETSNSIRLKHRAVLPDAQPGFANRTGLRSKYFAGGIAPQAHFEFQVGRSYLVFAVRNNTNLDTYSPLCDKPGHLYGVNPARNADSVMLTSDNTPLVGLSVKDAHWIELKRLLTNSISTNVIYAVERLDTLGTNCTGASPYSDDFKREAILEVLSTLLAHTNESVALAAIKCFQVGTQCLNKVAVHANSLVQVANDSPYTSCRLAAISALAGTQFESVSNSLSQLITDPSEMTRVEAVRLLLNYCGQFAERWLSNRANDESPAVRSVVADAIGHGKLTNLLPTLAKLFADSAGHDKLIPPMTTNHLMAGIRSSAIGDVYTSAGFALVEFEPDDVASILKTNLDDPGFHNSFVAKLAEKDAKPWLAELITILEARRTYVKEVARARSDNSRRLIDPLHDQILIGTYAKCWEDIRQYLLGLPDEELLSGGMKRHLDLLEDLVQKHSSSTVTEARRLYELYRTKSLGRRAKGIRQAYPDQKRWFDNFDEQHPELTEKAK